MKKCCKKIIGITILGMVLFMLIPNTIFAESIENLVYQNNIIYNNTFDTYWGGSGAYTGAITANGDLYMWGGSSLEDLGPEFEDRYWASETPVKVFTNAFSLYMSHTSEPAGCPVYVIDKDRALWYANFNKKEISWEKIMDNAATVYMDTGYHGDSNHILDLNGNLYFFREPFHRESELALVTNNVVDFCSYYDQLLILKNNGDAYYCDLNNNTFSGYPQNFDDTAMEKVAEDVISIGVLKVAVPSFYVINKEHILYGWGGNHYGQLGNENGTAGTTNWTGYENKVRILENAAEVDGSKDSIPGIALIKTMDSSLWGFGDKYALGIGVPFYSPDRYQTEPVKIMDNVKEFGIFNNKTTFVLKNDNTLWTFDTTQNIPTYVLDNVTDFKSSGVSHVALKNDGTLWGAGNNNYNQLTNQISNKIPRSDTEYTKIMSDIMLPIGYKLEKIDIILNGEKIHLEKQPFIEGNRVLVPLRAIFEALGANVSWDGSTQTVTASKGSTNISLQINSAKMYVNGETKTLDVPAKLIDNKTCVPVRAISEAFGCTVGWDDETRTVIITQ